MDHIKQTVDIRKSSKPPCKPVQASVEVSLLVLASGLGFWEASDVGCWRPWGLGRNI